jgi:hypothetical protein
VLKDAGYVVLGRMITAIEAQPLEGGPSAELALSDRIHVALEAEIDRLRGQMSDTVSVVLGVLDSSPAAMLRREHGRWESENEWPLINAADSCGT